MPEPTQREVSAPSPGQIIVNTNRGTGRTTRQIAALPKGAIFFVHTQSMKDYVRRLCQTLGRADIRIETLGELRPFRWAGYSLPGADIDHAAYERMNIDHCRAWDELRWRIGLPVGVTLERIRS